MSEMIERLLKNKVSFLADAEPDDIALSSRVRLARNIGEYSFPPAADGGQLEAVRELIGKAVEESGALGSDFLAFYPDTLDGIEREILFERRLVSRDFLERAHGTALFCRADEVSGVMVNEEDHLRIQSLTPGFNLEEAWKRADTLDNELGARLDYAFDGELGFLTSCPTNVGTGMRASVMLHLPGLVLSGQIKAAIQGVNKLNLAVRGIFGEGTENTGNLFQISNQSTLGESELQIIERLNSVISRLITHEKNARIMLLEKEQYTLMDHVGRAYGLLRHAYKLTSKETIDALSGIRLGVDMKMFSNVDVAAVNELFININPAHLQKLTDHSLEKHDRDIQRAAMVRERLK